MTELAVLIPVLARPHRVEPTLRSIFKNTKDARVVFITDPDDDEERRVIQTVQEVFGKVEELVCEGKQRNYARKINLGVRETSEPLLFFGADDLEFHPRWLEEAKAKLKGGIGVVATNDLCNPRVGAGELATHPLVTRAYTKKGTIDNSEVVLHEGYQHEYVDREFSETAQYRNAFAYAPDSVVEHLHPLVGKAPNDHLYNEIWTRMYQGRRLYSRRCNKWGMTRQILNDRNARDKRRRIDGWK